MNLAEEDAPEGGWGVDGKGGGVKESARPSVSERICAMRASGMRKSAH